MTWARALGYVGLRLILTGVYVLSHREGGEQTSPVSPQEAASLDLDDVPMEEETPATPYLRVEPGSVVEVEVSSGERRVRAAREGERWVVAEPPGGVVSSDLFAALVSAVLDASGVQVMSAEATRDAEFGLEQPEARVRFVTGNGGGVELLLGNENPAKTGVYGRAGGSPDIVLVGLNARYYVRLILRAAG